jgi:hypothetical protein
MRHGQGTKDMDHFDSIGSSVFRHCTCSRSVAFERDEINVRVQHDRGALLNPSNQVARHRCRQTLRADEHMDPTGGPREEDSRPGRRHFPPVVRQNQIAGPG